MWVRKIYKERKKKGELHLLIKESFVGSYFILLPSLIPQNHYFPHWRTVTSNYYFPIIKSIICLPVWVGRLMLTASLLPNKWSTIFWRVNSYHEMHEITYFDWLVKMSHLLSVRNDQKKLNSILLPFGTEHKGKFSDHMMFAHAQMLFLSFPFLSEENFLEVENRL